MIHKRGTVLERSVKYSTGTLSQYYFQKIWKCTVWNGDVTKRRPIISNDCILLAVPKDGMQLWHFLVILTCFFTLYDFCQTRLYRHTCANEILVEYVAWHYGTLVLELIHILPRELVIVYNNASLSICKGFPLWYFYQQTHSLCPSKLFRKITFCR